MNQNQIDKSVVDGIENGGLMLQKAQEEINPPVPVFQPKMRAALVKKVGEDKVAMFEALLQAWRGGTNG
jgi:hypothetical protein